MCKNAYKLSLFTQTLKFKDSVNVESTFKRSVNDEWSVELNKVWQKCENSFFFKPEKPEKTSSIGKRLVLTINLFNAIKTKKCNL